MSEATIDPEQEFADALRACLDEADPDAALIALVERTDADAQIAALSQPLGNLYALFGSRALLHKSRPDTARAFLAHLSWLWYGNQLGDRNLSRLASENPCLNGPIIESYLAGGEQMLAVHQLIECAGDMRAHEPHLPGDDPHCAALMAHPKAAAYGPFLIAHEWLVDMIDHTMAMAPLDQRLAAVQRLHAAMAKQALLAQTPERVLPLIERELDWYLSAPAVELTHFEFNAICVLAVLGRFDEAISAAQRLLRRGYSLFWRFDLERAKTYAWTQQMRQSEWLGPLSQTPEYAALLRDFMPGPWLGEGADVNPFCAIHDGDLGGTKRKKCAVSRKLIQPGEPIIRYRRLFDRASDGDLEIAAKAAFETSPWQENRLQFESNTIPVSQLFPRGQTRAALLEAPFICEFAFDTARAPDKIDLARAVQLIADHEPPPLRHRWNQRMLEEDGDDGWRDTVEAFEPLAGDSDYGDAVDLTWRLYKAGFGAEMVKQISALPEPKASKVFAMLATFDATDLRAAAAQHFAAPKLPAMMEMVFAQRPNAEEILALADFGGATPGFRAGLVQAMRGYNLHLYSNTHPSADWFRQELEQFTMAKGCNLLSFLIHSPQEEPVLATLVDKGWIADTWGGGSLDAYRNSEFAYLRAALFHFALHDRDKLDQWLAPDVVARWCTSAKDRETLRLVKQVKPAKS